MGMKLINIHGLNFLLFSGHDLLFSLANNRHCLCVFAIVMAMEKEKKQGRRLPRDLSISCISTTAESRAKI